MTTDNVQSLDASGRRRQLPGEREGEGRALSLYALYPELAPIVLNDLTRDRQPNAQTRRASLMPALYTIVPLEDFLLFHCGDADTEILDADRQALSCRADMNNDLLCLR